MPPEKMGSTVNGNQNAGVDSSDESASDASNSPTSRRKLAPHFVDDVSNISISPSGACRIYFNTWSSDETGTPVRVESELIMTMQSLSVLAKALPEAIEQARVAQQQERRR